MVSERVPGGGRHAHPRTTAGERGSVLVESAIVAPLLMLLLFGIMEMGSLLRSYSTAANAARAAGRAASIAGADPMADRMILSRLAQESSGGVPGQIPRGHLARRRPRRGRAGGLHPRRSTESPNLASLGVSDGGVDALGACNVYVRPAAPGGAFELRRGGARRPPNPNFGCQGPDDPDAADDGRLLLAGQEPPGRHHATRVARSDRAARTSSGCTSRWSTTTSPTSWARRR